jgi:ketosteroid isomerase-like protein
VSDAQAEIVRVEAEFCALAREQGVRAAFLRFAAPDAVILRDGALHRGQAGIAAYYDRHGPGIVRLDWKPDLVEVAASGDFAYTYGAFTCTLRDDSGKESAFSGVFHTVWKRQPDGSWRFVWD